ncbi:MAG TPA: hydroxyphenylacetyl-CoA thioesterase PaaI [Flavisolibacter sp.]|nr:hydroxyphenylacetyl-CoA thioesterase PaaI [Flavisolibacter sp.]
MNCDQVVEHMMKNDRFSQWLGIEIIKIEEGYAKLKMKLRDEMVNGFGVIHGGITFSFADSALALACNNRNNFSLALDVSISFTKTALPGQVLTADAKEMHNGRSTGLYIITIKNEKEEQVALFKGTCFRTGKNLI